MACSQPASHLWPLPKVAAVSHTPAPATYGLQSPPTVGQKPEGSDGILIVFVKSEEHCIFPEQGTTGLHARVGFGNDFKD